MAISLLKDDFLNINQILSVAQTFIYAKIKIKFSLAITEVGDCIGIFSVNRRPRPYLFELLVENLPPFC